MRTAAATEPQSQLEHSRHHPPISRFSRPAELSSDSRLPSSGPEFMQHPHLTRTPTSSRESPPAAARLTRTERTHLSLTIPCRSLPFAEAPEQPAQLQNHATTTAGPNKLGPSRHCLPGLTPLERSHLWRHRRGLAQHPPTLPRLWGRNHLSLDPVGADHMVNLIPNFSLTTTTS